MDVTRLMRLGRQVALMAVLGMAAGCASKHPADRAASSVVGTSLVGTSLVGTWSAQAEETVDPAGRTLASSPARGLLVYTPEGRMAVQIVVLPRPVVPAVPEGPGEVNAWNPEQTRTVIETYDAYFGTYEIDEAHHTVTHHVQGELRPNLDGAAFRRRYEIDGDRLTLRSTDPRETWRVVWKRVR